MKDRRKDRRRQLYLYLKIYDKATSASLGNLVDISTRGIMVLTEQPLPENTLYHLRMVLPGNIMAQEEFIFDAVSRWSHIDTINPEYFNTGFRFVGLSPADESLIERLIEEVGFLDI